MKKAVIIVLALIMLMSFVSCAVNEVIYKDNSTTSTKKEASSSTEAKEDEKPTPDSEFKGLVIGISDANLARPAYKKDGIVYADLGGVIKYFDGNVSYDADKKFASAFDGTRFYTFEAGNKQVLITDQNTQETTTATMDNAPIKTDDGFDFPLPDLAKLMDLSISEKNGYTVLKKK